MEKGLKIFFAFIGIILVFGVLFVILGVLGSGRNSSQNNYSKQKVTEEKTSSEVKKVEQNQNKSDNQENKPSEEISEHRDTSLKGRGDPEIDGSRQEPNYKNVIGYVVVYPSDFNPDVINAEIPQEPWTVKDFYESKILEHKTEVVVKSQDLHHQVFDLYKGSLTVERLSNREKFTINVKNFVTKPYWQYGNLINAAQVGSFIAEDLNTGERVLVTGGNTTDLIGYVWQENVKQLHGKVYNGLVKKNFKPEQLKIIY